MPCQTTLYRTPIRQGSSFADGVRLILRSLEQVENMVTSLKCERAELMCEKEQLMVDKDSFASILADEDKDRRTIRHLERKLAESKTETTRLNSIIVDRGQPDEVLDEEKLVYDYRSVLRTVADITRSHYISPIVRPLIPVAGWTEDERGDHQKRYERR